MPAHPAGWLVATARHRAIDRIRRDRTLAEKTRRLETAETTMDEFDETVTVEDERLELIFTCCHPALAPEAQVALTLRAVGGLTTEEIARGFLLPTETMKRRLTRAKTKIRQAGIPFAVPSAERLPDRLEAVLTIVYLIYNEGYGGRIDLAAEAIRLGALLAELMPDESEVHGLLGLMRIQHSRHRARFAGGELVRLADQNRALWDMGAVRSGRASLERAIALRGRGPHVVQAAIASLQAEPEIDWPQVAELYGRLVTLTGSPVAELNHAAALAQAGAPEHALAMIDALDLGGYRYVHSTRAELLRRLGRGAEARDAYRRALELAATEPERRFLARALAELDSSAPT